MYSPSSFSF